MFESYKQRECYECQVNKYIENVDLPPAQLQEYKKRQYDNIANLKDDTNIFEFNRIITKEYENTFGKVDYTETKYSFNELLLNKYEQLRQNILSKDDELLCALKTALVGNYVDFSAFDKVEENKLFELINNVDNFSVDLNVYEDLKNDLSNAKSLVYLLDNCGEIVLDKLFIERIRINYPNVKITAIVRGGEIVNDVSMKDANQVKLYEVCDVVDNGITWAGTFLNELPISVRDTITNADLIISKGQANAESLYGNNLNIYYVFLCKCAYFARKFNAEKMQPVLSKEK